MREYKKTKGHKFIVRLYVLSFLFTEGFIILVSLNHRFLGAFSLSIAIVLATAGAYNLNSYSSLYESRKKKRNDVKRLDTIKICIADEFSQYPCGRYRSDSSYSAERFRDDFLIPAIENNKYVVVDLDGTIGYSSCFLEEVFGGLVRCGFSISEIEKKLYYKSDDEFLFNEISRYIKNANYYSENIYQDS